MNNKKIYYSINDLMDICYYDPFVKDYIITKTKLKEMKDNSELLEDEQ